MTRLKNTLSIALLSISAAVASATAEDLDAYAWYVPYHNLLRADVTLPKDLRTSQNAAQLNLRLQLRSPQNAVVFDRTVPLNEVNPLPPAAPGDLDATQGLQFKADLDNGTYTARIMVVEDGGDLLAEVKNEIVLRSYEFMHTQAGRERKVIPPFDPIATKANTAQVWKRQFSFSPSGFPARIDVLGKNILAEDGVQLRLRQGDRVLVPEMKGFLFFDPEFKMTTTDGYDATGTATGKLGPLSYRLEGRLEYDGCYFIELTLDSNGETVNVDQLELLIPFADGADTYSFQKNDKDIRTAGGLSRFGGIRPDQEGVIFDARELPMRSAYNLGCDNHFVPAIYVGSGTRGLWYYADSDWEWYLNPANEHATLEKVDGRVQLRIQLVNDHLEWNGKRRFEFALMPQPVKPMPTGWRRLAWGYPEDQYIHDTSGWRYYGDGVNAFTLPTDDDYRQLGDVLHGRKKPPKNANPGYKIQAPDDTRPFVLYGSSLMAGSGPANGEWNTFSGEWVNPQFAQMPFNADVKNRFQKFTSYGGYDWQENISFKPCAVQWTDSWLDFAVYYQQKLVSLAEVNGTWFDNQSCFTIDGYTDNGFEQRLLDNPKRWQPESGEHRAKNYGRPYHILQFRRYLKRLATMCHVAGVRPFWMVNQHPTWSFAQFAWHIEADFYCTGSERDIIEHMGIAGFRAHVNTQGGLIKRLHSSVKISDQPLREGNPETLGVRISDATAFHRPGAKRTHTGMCLLHDIGMIGSDRLVLQTLDENFGFFDNDVKFEPYWSQDSAKADSDRIRISLFRNPANNKTVAVVFNEKWSPRGVTTDFENAESATVSDLKSGEPLKDLDKQTPGLQTRLWIPPRDFRLLVWDN